ncbi:MAG: response regulator transcription factor [Oceanicaulis sp.]
MSDAKKTIGVVEDDPALAARLAQVIEAADGLALAFAAGTLADALAALDAGPPDLCLVDIDLPDGKGLDVVATLHRTRPDAKALILTVLGDRESVITAMQIGADGYLLKDTEPAQLVRHIELTLAGEAPMSPRAAAHLLTLVRRPVPAAASTPMLTEREVEVLNLFARGLKYREVADALSISAHTVGDHVKAIYRKLSVQSRSEAVYEARQLGLIDRLG